LYLTVVSISISWVTTISGISKSGISISTISGISMVSKTISVRSVKNSWVGLSFPLDKRVRDNSAGANSEGSTVGVLLLKKSRGREKAGNLVDGSDKISIVSGLSLVSSNGNWDWEIGGGDISLELERLDSISEGMGGIWVSIGTGISQTTIDTGIGKATVHESCVGLSFPLDERVRDNSAGANSKRSSTIH